MIYINDLVCISPQATFSENFINGEISIQSNLKWYAIEPDYKRLIPTNLLRRMGKAVRMGVGAGISLTHKNAKIDGIILATANGGLADCLKFLNQIVDYKEGTLTPTNFVQSTPNAVAGNLALICNCVGYNITHVHLGSAFENALIDALMLCDEEPESTFLLGTVDEISEYNFNINQLNNQFKVGEVDSLNLLDSDTNGSVNGEGVAWFTVSSKPDNNTVAAILDVTVATNVFDVSGWITEFLAKNNMTQENVDAVIFGENGDMMGDGIYNLVYDNLFKGKLQIAFKHLVGEYPTVSSFATWLGVRVMEGKSLNEIMIRKGKIADIPNTILIYNHYFGAQHNLILMKRIY